MKIAQEAIKIVIISLIAIIISLYIARRFHAIYIISFISFIIFAFSLYFFRDPERNKNFIEKEIPSPADGTVISISNEGTDKIIVRIFLSIFNVHIQRSPVDGRIKEIKFFPGKFHIASTHQAKDNQRNLIKIETEQGKEVWVEQITGAIARRINCYVKEGDIVKKGQRIGIIYFGSQVAIYLPKDVNIKVKPNDKIKAGLDVIATW
ncbi:MAG: phosphatidylserine decarboxylase [Elusimicrobiales bacterium]|nr:phosphatidylserine decarboxylase [Elusimicrobiales bacterium]